MQKEVTKLKERREEREEEREEMERLKLEEARLREQSMYGDWEKKEEMFHLEQSRRRTKMRIDDGRERPIDILAKNLGVLPIGKESEWVPPDHAFEVDLSEPYTVFEDLPASELTELKVGMTEYREMESDKLQEYWEDLLIVCGDALDTTAMREVELGDLSSGAVRSAPVHDLVREEVNKSLRGKSYGELECMHDDVAAKVKSGTTGTGLHLGEAVDVEYWSAVLKSVAVGKAKARLDMLHEEILTERLRQLGEIREQFMRDAEGQGIGAELAAVNWDEDEEGDGWSSGGEDGSFSPLLIPFPDEGTSPDDFSLSSVGEEGVEVVDADADRRELEAERERIAARERQRNGTDVGAGGGDSMQGVPAAEDGEEAMAETDVVDLPPQVRGAVRGAGRCAGWCAGWWRAVLLWRWFAVFHSAFCAERFQGMDAMLATGDANAFTNRTTLTTISLVPSLHLCVCVCVCVCFHSHGQIYTWNDKFRPRKPRYFNRVKTGYEWNKYNSAHYDHDNPPPKIVQGYKINIFYPGTVLCCSCVVVVARTSLFISGGPACGRNMCERGRVRRQV